MGVNIRLATICAAASLTVLSATAAYGDTIYNSLDLTVDSELETMSLTYDVVSGGSTSSTTLAIQIDGKPADHAGCNIQGGAHFIALDATSSQPSVATVQLSNDGVFDQCGDTVLATVSAHELGESLVTFAIDAERTSNDPKLTFSLAEAAFKVAVNPPATDGDGGTVCDADPAAPAWAAAILKANGIKPNAGGPKNYVSQVAEAMTQGALFGGYAKNAHSEYEKAVLAYLKTITNRQDLVMGSRPGWECHPVTTN